MIAGRRQLTGDKKSQTLNIIYCTLWVIYTEGRGGGMWGGGGGGGWRGGGGGG